MGTGGGVEITGIPVHTQLRPYMLPYIDSLEKRVGVSVISYINVQLFLMCQLKFQRAVS